MQDLLERPISGTFYVKELQNVNRPDIFRIEKVLEKNKQEEYLVRWPGYSSDFDSWLTSNDLVPLSKKLILNRGYST